MIMITQQGAFRLHGSSESMGRPANGGKAAPQGLPTNFALKAADLSETAEAVKSGITPLRMTLITLLIGLFGYLYISHVFYTQKLHAEVLQLRSQFEQVRLEQTQTQLTYERMTGPAEVYTRAQSLGLIDGGPADKIINRSPNVRNR